MKAREVIPTMAKSVVIGAILCCLAGLCAGMARAQNPPSKSADGKAAAQTGRDPSAFVIRGTVVDEKGAPVPNVTVMTSKDRKSVTNPTARTDAAGSFTLDLPQRPFRALLLAKDNGGGRIGILQYVPGKSSPAPAARIVLHPARTIPVMVVDGNERPVAGVKVGVAFDHRNGVILASQAAETFTRESTDGAGKALLRLPGDMPLACICAVKAGAGFDYVLYRTQNDRKQNGKQKPAVAGRRSPDDSRPIKFVLGGVHTVRAHVVDERRRPLPGVRVRLMFVKRPDRGGPATISGIGEFEVVSDRTGVAQFDAIPSEAAPVLVFMSGSMKYRFQEQPNFDPAEKVTDFTIPAMRLPVLGVEVTYPDGRPAVGARLAYVACRIAPGHAGRISLIGSRLYDPAGDHEIQAFHEDAYCVVSATSDRFASVIAARVARLGEAVRPVHLVLEPGIRVHGTLTVGKNRRPAADQWLTLIQEDTDNYSKLPEDERSSRIQYLAVNIPFTTSTDAQGRFEFYAVPGRYVVACEIVALNLAANPEAVKMLVKRGAGEFELKERKEFEINLHCETIAPAERVGKK